MHITGKCMWSIGITYSRIKIILKIKYIRNVIVFVTHHYCEFSHCSLSEEGLQGLQGELNLRRSEQWSQLVTVRNKSLQVIKEGLDGSTLDLDEGEEQFEEQDVASELESCSDENDMDMQVMKDVIFDTSKL